jgi:hypothetical protein
VEGHPVDPSRWWDRPDHSREDSQGRQRYLAQGVAPRGRSDGVARAWESSGDSWGCDSTEKHAGSPRLGVLRVRHPHQLRVHDRSRVSRHIDDADVLPRCRMWTSVSFEPTNRSPRCCCTQRLARYYQDLQGTCPSTLPLIQTIALAVFEFHECGSTYPHRIW